MLSTKLGSMLVRYSGMICVRGLVDGNAHPDLLNSLKKEYPLLGVGTTMDISDNSICLIYALANNLINWLWCGHSFEIVCLHHAPALEDVKA